MEPLGRLGFPCSDHHFYRDRLTAGISYGLSRNFRHSTSKQRRKRYAHLFGSELFGLYFGMLFRLRDDRHLLPVYKTWSQLTKS